MFAAGLEVVDEGAGLVDLGPLHLRLADSQDMNTRLLGVRVGGHAI